MTSAIAWHVLISLNWYLVEIYPAKNRGSIWFMLVSRHFALQCFDFGVIIGVKNWTRQTWLKNSYELGCWFQRIMVFFLIFHPCLFGVTLGDGWWWHRYVLCIFDALVQTWTSLAELEWSCHKVTSLGNSPKPPSCTPFWWIFRIQPDIYIYILELCWID